MNRKLLTSILRVVFIDLLGFSLILPLLPYYAETFNASEFVTDLLIAVYILMQLIIFAAIYMAAKILNHPIVISLREQQPAPVHITVNE